MLLAYAHKNFEHIKQHGPDGLPFRWDNDTIPYFFPQKILSGNCHLSSPSQ